jgi:hypothetical protein
MSETETTPSEADERVGEPTYRIEAEVLSRDAATMLREVIEDTVDCNLTAFNERIPEPECGCKFCDDGKMYRSGPKVVCDSCGEVKLA